MHCSESLHESWRADTEFPDWTSFADFTEAGKTSNRSINRLLMSGLCFGELQGRRKEAVTDRALAHFRVPVNLGEHSSRSDHGNHSNLRVRETLSADRWNISVECTTFYVQRRIFREHPLLFSKSAELFPNTHYFACKSSSCLRSVRQGV